MAKKRSPKQSASLRQPSTAGDSKPMSELSANEMADMTAPIFHQLHVEIPDWLESIGLPRDLRLAAKVALAEYGEWVDDMELKDFPLNNLIDLIRTVHAKKTWERTLAGQNPSTKQPTKLTKVPLSEICRRVLENEEAGRRFLCNVGAWAFDDLRPALIDILDVVFRTGIPDPIASPQYTSAEVEARARIAAEFGAIPDGPDQWRQIATELHLHDAATAALDDDFAVRIGNAIRDRRASGTRPDRNGRTNTRRSMPVVTLDDHPQIVLDGIPIALRDDAAVWLKALIDCGNWMSDREYKAKHGSENDRPDRWRKKLPPAVLARIETQKSKGSRWRLA